jgi:alanine-glyoxylate transaminase/serine-glyoxylate transaminase/serine-pyruvate transaminase
MILLDLKINTLGLLNEYEDYMTDTKQETINTKLMPNKILLGPGPSMAHPRVLQAMMQSMIGYLDPDFIPVLDEIACSLKKIFKTKNTTLVIPGTGSAGMEAGLSSLLEPGDKVIMCIYGFFCERMVEMAERIGAEVIPLRAEWGNPFPEELLEMEIKKHPEVKLVTAIHGETSTGVVQELSGLSRIAKDHGALFMVDAVTTFAGRNIETDNWNIDYIYSASQKCLGAPPGLSPAAISDEALSIIRNRKSKPVSWYLDLDLLCRYWSSERLYHHTAPVSMLYGINESLKIVLEEGLETRFERHKINAEALIAGLTSLGLNPVAREGNRLEQITPVWIPNEIDDIKVRNMLLEEYSIELGRGLGDFSGKVWRVGLMGESSKQEYVLTFLAALDSILPRVGYEVAQGRAISEATRIYNLYPSKKKS